MTKAGYTPNSDTLCVFFLQRKATISFTSSISDWADFTALEGFDDQDPTTISQNQAYTLTVDAKPIILKFQCASGDELRVTITNVQGGGRYEGFGSTNINPTPPEPENTPTEVPTPSPATPTPATPTPATPTPATPTPATPTPATPTPATPTPATPTPATPTPATPTPATPTPATPTPATHTPATPNPETPIPETPNNPQKSPDTYSPTPDATWDGEYDDPPNVLIRGNDIPQIFDSHPPIQTNYVKTPPPKEVVVISISSATIIAIAGISLSVFNAVRSAKLVKDIVNGVDVEGDDNDDFSFESWIDLSYSISDTSNDVFHI
ncbi:serine/threonine-protein kinase C, putative [Trichomonas vaginalis G3]|uniref:Serine/threonine-protein kinase C, putative n=1 Tax=Trichomonas vaginalis (strain ATCC PRA-98 / G3) TaxID=412133 RepID=A2EKB2_TRIV3|nr:hypothetical protein TVAGG3_0772700 [Trichomonas vaginalis G3]EAY06910.1 serine/threonine-protein kinase C, putative [Trichomonas vaginalis G3]KAI5513925.1 hypothetical protein TVAGG3_0772700 [Trichomonas vaginalis G3]|eukprot:XP_001319133.1 serine/threonine-protein kinase C [Trichomonas vaginalis G3]